MASVTERSAQPRIRSLLKGLAEFMTTEKVNLGLDDYNDEDFEDGFEETQPQTLSQVDLPKFRVEGFWGERLDKVLAAHLPDVSRARLAKLIENGSVKLKGCFNARVALKYKERRISRRLWTIS